jgi:RNA 3'-terminal phosphate cyclase (ATP)
MSLIELDGAVGEGGGQILRTSLALSLITGRGFHLHNVRAGRNKPGLQAQHLTSVRAAATIGGAGLRGASLGSSDLVFEPGPVRPGAYRFDVGTAGAVGLVLHTIYLPLAYRAATPSTVTLTGGTHVRTSPSFHFLDTTWRAYAERYGVRISLRLARAGFYPRGGGVAEASLQPAERLVGGHLAGSGVPKVSGFSAVAGLPADIARRQARRAVYRLEQFGMKAVVREQTWEGGPGTVLALEVSGGPVPALFVSIGERGKPAERVADDATDEAIAHLKAGAERVDAHSADQLVLPLALAEGASQYDVSQITRHLTTNAAVIRRFIDRSITITGAEGEPGFVRID